MRLRDLFNRSEEPAPDPSSDGSGGHQRELLRQAADLIAAGDEAISRALSGDSEKFLAANRQEGGQ